MGKRASPGDPAVSYGHDISCPFCASDLSAKTSFRPANYGFCGTRRGAVLLGSLTLSVTEAIDAIGNHCEYRKSFPGSRLLAGKRTFPGAMREEMSVPVTKLSFWGVRGSTPTVDPATWRYGGNTPCLELVAPDGTQFILDCG